MARACSARYASLEHVHPLLPAAAKELANACRGRLTSKWAPEANRLFAKWQQLDACMPRYAAFVQAARVREETAQKRLLEFYLCCALRLRHGEAVSAKQDKKRLLAIASSVAAEEVLPFFDDCRRFTAGLDEDMHTRLADLERFRDVDMGLYWHHSFNVAAPDAYAAYRSAVLPSEAEWPAADDVASLDGLMEPIKHDVAFGDARSLADTTYRAFLEASVCLAQRLLHRQLHGAGLIGNEDLLSTESGSQQPSYGGGVGYWNERYQKKAETFDWLEGYENLRFILDDISEGNRSTHFLHIGCGNQQLAADMHDDGYSQIVNIDNSQVAIEQMIAQNKCRPELVWLVMDATNTTFPDGRFDVVLDKSLLDCLECNDEADIETYLQEVSRILRPGGTFLCVSFRPPDERMTLFTSPTLHFNVRHIELPRHIELGDKTPNHAYVCRKYS